MELWKFNFILTDSCNRHNTVTVPGVPFVRSGICSLRLITAEEESNCKAADELSQRRAFLLRIAISSLGHVQKSRPLCCWSPATASVPLRLWHSYRDAGPEWRFNGDHQLLLLPLAAVYLHAQIIIMCLDSAVLVPCSLADNNHTHIIIIIIGDDWSGRQTAENG